MEKISVNLNPVNAATGLYKTVKRTLSPEKWKGRLSNIKRMKADLKKANIDIDIRDIKQGIKKEWGKIRPGMIKDVGATAGVGVAGVAGLGGINHLINKAIDSRKPSNRG